MRPRNRFRRLETRKKVKVIPSSSDSNLNVFFFSPHRGEPAKESERGEKNNDNNNEALKALFRSRCL